MTKIPWTEKSWNPVVGCTKIATGCKNCYAERMACRLAYMGQEKYQKVTGYVNEWTHWIGNVFCDESVLDKPLHWRKPRKIFVCSMGDLFHPAVPFEFIDKIFRLFGKVGQRQHIYQILTKRPNRMAEYISYAQKKWMAYWPYQKVWLGTSISTQADADKNIPILLQIPAAVRFVSLEPMLARIYLPRSYCTECGRITRERQTHGCKYGSGGNCRCGKYLSYVDAKLDWVIIGCESGPGARLCSIEDIRDAVRQCKEANVPVFVKQVPIDIDPGRCQCNSCHDKCSKKPEEWPEDLRIQEYPK